MTSLRNTTTLQTQLEWTDDGSVGNDYLDNQHKELFGIINSLANSNEIGYRSEEFHEILTKLTNYVLQHFKDEAAYFAEIGYVESKEHIKEHRDYAYEVAMFSVQTMEGDWEAPKRMVSFLTKWWSDHVRESDQEYRRFAESLSIIDS